MKRPWLSLLATRQYIASWRNRTRRKQPPRTSRSNRFQRESTSDPLTCTITYQRHTAACTITTLIVRTSRSNRFQQGNNDRSTTTTNKLFQLSQQLHSAPSSYTLIKPFKSGNISRFLWVQWCDSSSPADTTAIMPHCTSKGGIPSATTPH